MKDLIPFIVIFLLQVLTENVGAEDFVDTTDPGCESIVNLTPEQEERVIDAIAMGLTVIYCTEGECFDLNTGEQYYASGPVWDDYIYFVDIDGE